MTYLFPQEQLFALTNWEVTDKNFPEFERNLAAILQNNADINQPYPGRNHDIIKMKAGQTMLDYYLKRRDYWTDRIRLHIASEDGEPEVVYGKKADLCEKIIVLLREKYGAKTLYEISEESVIIRQQGYDHNMARMVNDGNDTLPMTGGGERLSPKPNSRKVQPRKKTLPASEQQMQAGDPDTSWLDR